MSRLPINTQVMFSEFVTVANFTSEDKKVDVPLSPALALLPVERKKILFVS